MGAVDRIMNKGGTMKRIEKMLGAVVCLALVAQLAGCGTLLHPERRGQRGGRLDAGIVVLDAIGLLFFVIPGIIAFAVDFSNGTIYLPGTAGLVKFDPKRATAATIEGIIYEKTGQLVKLNQPGMRVSRLGSLAEMRNRFAELLPEENIRVAKRVN